GAGSAVMIASDFKSAADIGPHVVGRSKRGLGNTCTESDSRCSAQRGAGGEHRAGQTSSDVRATARGPCTTQMLLRVSFTIWRAVRPIYHSCAMWLPSAWNASIPDTLGRKTPKRRGVSDIYAYCLFSAASNDPGGFSPFDGQSHDKSLMMRIVTN